MSESNSIKASRLSEEAFWKRLWPRVKKGLPSECWPWTGGTMKSKDRKQGGYGMIGIGSRVLKDRNQLYVHREVYRNLVGPIPEGMHVMHLCDNRVCCNPRHLSVGTQQDNLRDMFEKKRHLQGERQPGAKLTDEKVREIRRLAAEGMMLKDIAPMFGVARSIVSRVVSRVIWSHVE